MLEFSLVFVSDGTKKSPDETFMYKNERMKDGLHAADKKEAS